MYRVGRVNSTCVSFPKVNTACTCVKRVHITCFISANIVCACVTRLQPAPSLQMFSLHVLNSKHIRDIKMLPIAHTCFKVVLLSARRLLESRQETNLVSILIIYKRLLLVSAFIDQCNTDKLIRYSCSL